MTENVVEYIRYFKDKKVFYLFCGHCESKFKMELPISFGTGQALKTLSCPHCLTDGFVVGQSSGRRR